MSMLAENRRKSKWVINPTKKPIWSTDSSGIKFGMQLMEKMGWSAGKGLGLKEQGIQEPLKVSFKNDTKGMGFKGNDDDWIEHQDEFNILLNQLRSNNDSSADKGSVVEKSEVKSLEEISKKSKARVHYQKFTRGKDLSRYSENDLACILGTGKTRKKEIPKTEEVMENEIKTDGNFETSFGVTTINSGSINDYFKKKWIVKPSGLDSKADEEREEENFRPSFSSGNSFIPVNHELNETGDCERVEKKKRKKQEVEINSGKAEPQSKRRRMNCNDNIGLENLLEEPESLSLESENNYNTGGEINKDNNHVKSNDGVESRKEKKERKKSKRNLEELTSEELEQTIDTNNGVISLEEEPSKRKKKKKDKKEKAEESEMIENEFDNDIQPEVSVGHASEPCLAIGFVKNKKKKKQKSEEIDNNVQDMHSIVEVKVSERTNRERNSGECEGEHTVEVETRKKKKKDKKEKLDKFNDTNIELSCCDNQNSSSLEVAFGEEVNEKSETENTAELESRKKKKKSKKEKLVENNEVENRNDQIVESCLNEITTGKIMYEEEGASGNELVKKKKKKKDKKEKYVEIEDTDKEPCLEGESILDEELTEKRKKKKHKKDKKEDLEGVEKEEEQDSKEMDLGVCNNGVNGVLNGNTGHDRLQKFRGNLFPDQAVDKYFPGQGTNERVLKLIRWANVEEFKGSNLNDLEGYGRRKIYKKQGDTR